MSLRSHWRDRGLALLAPAVLLLSGCGGENEPSKNGIAELSALSIQALGTLDLGFAADKTAYTVQVASSRSVTLVPTLAHPLASITVNGKAQASGVATDPIAITPTPTPITIQVVAQNGNTRTYTVTASLAGSTPVGVSVLGSMGGERQVGATLSVAEATGKAFETAIPMDRSGFATLYLDAAKAYDLKASKTGRAESCLAAFRPAASTTADHYCQPVGMNTFPSVAPVLEEVAVSPDQATWSTVANGQVQGTLASMRYLRVKVLGRCLVAPTSWGGPGLIASLDRTAGAAGYITPTILEEGTPVTVNGATWYRSTGVFSLDYAGIQPDDSRVLSLVAYDVANNRCETRVKLTPSDVTPAGTDPDLSAMTPLLTLAQGVTYGVGLDFYSLPPTPGKDSLTAYAALNFRLTSGTPAVNVGIRGFEVYRSADAGASWKKLGAKHYTSLSTGSSGTHTFSDFDSALEANLPYLYKVKAYTANTARNGGWSAESAPLGTTLLKPFVVALSAPADGTVTKTLAPTLGFTLSEPALMEAAVSDTFTWMLILKEKGNGGFYLQRFRYDLPTGKFQYRTSDTAAFAEAPAAFNLALSADKRTITFTPAGIPLVPGKAYEWTIAGLYDPATGAITRSAYFWKFYLPPATTSSALSCGSNANQTNGAENGYFTLILDPAAQ